MSYTFFVFVVAIVPIVCCFVFDIHVVIGTIYLLVIGFPLCVVGYDLIIEAKDW